MIQISHVTQSLPSSCVSACLAMALGLPQDQVISEFHDDYFSGKTTLGKYLTSKGIDFVPLGFEEAFYPEDDEDEHVYFMTVPSLNIEGGLHEIIWYWWEGGNKIFDPAKGFVSQKGKRGKKKRKFYVASKEEMGDDKLARVNTGRIVDLVITGKELRRFRASLEKS